MKMKINVSNKITKDTFHTLVPMNWLLRSTGLSNIYRYQNQLSECGSIIKSTIYVIICAVINFSCLYYKMETFQGNAKTGLIKFYDSVQLTYWISYLEYVVDIYLVYKYTRGSLIKYIEAYDHIDAILGSPSHEKIRKIIIQSILISIAIFCLNSLFDYVFWLRVDGWKSATAYSVDYLYFFLNILTVLDVNSHVIQVEYRLKRIGDLVQSYSNIDFIKTIIDDTISNISAKNSRSKSLESLKILGYAKYFETDWFVKCYLQLLQQVSFINSTYGFRILVFCLNLLINMISLLNLAFRIINGTMVPADGCGPFTYLPSISSTTRALNYSLMATILMYRCEKTYRQSDRILELIDMLLTSKKYNNDIKNNLVELRNFLISRPIKFHAANFFIMDYTLLVSMSSVVVGYTIIMLQSMQ